MGEDRPHPEIAQVQQGAAQRRLDEEDMAHPGPGQGPRQPFGAVHRGCFAHAVSSLTADAVPSVVFCMRAEALAPSTDVPYRLTLGAMVSARTSRMSRC